MTEEEMESSIQWEAEQYIPFDISEVNLDFQILGPDAKDPSQMNVILVAAKKDFVNDYVTVFKECGLNPLVMDIDCFAIENVFEVQCQCGNERNCRPDQHGRQRNECQYSQGGDSVFTRDIQVGGNMFNEEIQKRLGLSSEDAEKAKLGRKWNMSTPRQFRKLSEMPWRISHRKSRDHSISSRRLQPMKKSINFISPAGSPKPPKSRRSWRRVSAFR